MKHLFLLRAAFVASMLLTTSVYTTQLTPYRIHCPQPCNTCNQCPQSPLVQEGFVPLAETVINDQVVPGGNIFARLEGAYVPGRPTIVMIHYVEGTHRGFACQQKAFAAAGYSTLALDMRGRGKSVKTDPATFFYTNQALANDIHSVLVALEIEGPIIMIGAVSGGYPVIKYFEMFSTPTSPYYDADRTLSHMVVINSGPGLTTVPDCAGLPGCVVDGTTCCVSGATCPFPCAGPNCCLCYEFGNVTCAGVNFFFTPQWSTPAGYFASACSFALSAMAEVGCEPQITIARKAFTEDFLATTGAIQINMYKNSLAEDLRPVIPTIDIPFLVVYSDLSPTIPGSSQYLAANAPNAILAFFEGASELPHITMVSKFNTLLNDFISGASLASSITLPFTGCDVCPLFVPTRPVNCPPVI